MNPKIQPSLLSFPPCNVHFGIQPPGKSKTGGRRIAKESLSQLPSSRRDFPGIADIKSSRARSFIIKRPGPISICFPSPSLVVVKRKTQIKDTNGT